MFEHLKNLFSTIKEDLTAHGGDWTRPGFQAIAVHRFGVWAKTRLLWERWQRAPFVLVSRMAHVFIRNFYGIELPFSARIGRRVIFEHQHGIVVHGNCVIGDDCVIRQGVTLGMRRMDSPHEAPILGRRVNVGAGAKILGDVFIGDGAQIGANCVVLQNVNPGGLVVCARTRHIGSSVPAILEDISVL